MSTVLHQNEYIAGAHGNALLIDALSAGEVDYTCQRALAWATAIPSLEPVREIGEVKYTATLHGTQELYLESRSEPEDDAGLEGAWAAVIALDDGHISIRIVAEDELTAASLIDRIREVAPRFEPDDDDPRVPVTFWSLGTMGPQSRTRMIDVPAWDEIGHNYGAAARDGLDHMMGDFEPGAGGQLVLWHGPPGTGKTFALRALAWQWREWCDIHYVTDPETFFGDKAAYMLEVLLHTDEATPVKAGAEPPRPRWRLLVLEDTGELLTADAKERTGQALSRLLNVCDGLIGQGLRLLVLVTTNEKVTSLHEAVARPGRCAALVEFDRLAPSEVEDWLERSGDLKALDTLDVGAHYTVADLFAALGGHRQGKRQAVGFTS